MKISLLDPGLALLLGHHFDLDLRLARALERRGHDVTVHGFIKQDAKLMAAAEEARMKLCATFNAWPYGAPAGSGGSMAFYRSIARITMEDLAGLPPADLWVWPTLFPYQFMAAIEEPRPIRQVCGIWFGPSYPLPIGARGWAHAARRIGETQSPITVGAYDELLCSAYRTFSPGLPVVRLPCPHDGAPNERRPTALRRIGFFGHQKATRGLDLIPQLVSNLLERGFEVLVQDSGREFVRQHDHPRLKILPFVLNFAAEIARCDLVIWPSRFEAYQLSHSGVVSESIATGVPIVLPSDCLPADLAARFGTGIFFREYSMEAILEAVHGAEQTYPVVAARAEAAKTKWHAENGTGRLVDRILEVWGA